MSWIEYFVIGTATTVDDTVENFISTHDEHHLKDVGVEDMRRIIPKFFMYCDDRDLKSCKKGLIWISYGHFKILVNFLTVLAE